MSWLITHWTDLLAWSIPAMWALYIIGIQYLRGGCFRLLLPVILLAAVFDVLMNYTVFVVLMWDTPRHGEYTFSMRLHRLQYAPGWRGHLARFIATRMLDPFDPSGKHIKP